MPPFTGKCPDGSAASSACCCRHFFSACLLHKDAVAQGAPPNIEIHIKLCLWMNGCPWRQRKQAHSSVYWKSCPCFVSPGFSVVLVWQRSLGRGDSFCCGCPVCPRLKFRLRLECWASQRAGLFFLHRSKPSREFSFSRCAAGLRSTDMFNAFGQAAQPLQPHIFLVLALSLSGQKRPGDGRGVWELIIQPEKVHYWSRSSPTLMVEWTFLNSAPGLRAVSRWRWIRSLREPTRPRQEHRPRSRRLKSLWTSFLFYTHLFQRSTPVLVLAVRQILIVWTEELKTGRLIK